MIDKDWLELGLVWPVNGLQHELHIRNVSRTHVHIRRFVTSCGCAAVEPSELVIAPGETHIVTVSLDLADRKGNDVVMRVAAVCDPSGSSESWNLRGRVRSAALAVPRHFALDEAVAGTRRTAVLNVNCTREVTGIDAHESANWLHLTKVMRRNAEEFAIVLTSKPLDCGEYATELSVVPRFSSRLDHPPLVVPVRLSVVEPVGVFPKAHHLGLQDVGKTPNTVVSVRSRIPLNFDVLDVNSADISCRDSVTLLASLCNVHGCKENRYLVRLPVAEAGHNLVVVLFDVVTDTGYKRTISAEIAYHGK